MAKLFYWPPKTTQGGVNVGHLSMRLNDGTYISHWPDSRDKLGIKTSRGMTNFNLEDDIDAEGELYSETVEIPEEKIDVGKIRQWWESIKKQKADYHLLFANCAQMVERALIEGGLKGFGGNLSPFGVLNNVKGASSETTNFSALHALVNALFL